MQFQKLILFLLSIGSTFIFSSNIFEGVESAAKIKIKQHEREGKRKRLPNAELAQEYLQQMTSRHLTDEGFDIFMQAMTENDFVTMQKMIEASDLESENESRATLLIIAICNDNRNVVQMLLKAGAKVEHGWKALTSDGYIPPLIVALMKNRKACVKDLLYAGAEIPKNMTFLHYVWLQEIKEEMNVTNQNAHGAFNFVRKQTHQRVHPMIQRRVSQMLLYPPRESSSSSQDSD